MIYWNLNQLKATDILSFIWSNFFMEQYQVLNYIKLLAHYKKKEKSTKRFVQDKMHFFKRFFSLYMCVPIIMCV